MESRNKILCAIRKQTVPAVDLPSLDRDWIQYKDPQQQFVDALSSVGGTAHRISDIHQVTEHAQKIPGFANAERIYSEVPGIVSHSIDLASIDDPHELDDVDFAIFRGNFGVAENGAIWMTDGELRHRALYFIAQHLIIVLPAAEIVHNMHEAYARLSFNDRQFGLFMSGPSKTADIEQSLVIGAHGARSLNVFLI